MAKSKSSDPKPKSAPLKPVKAVAPAANGKAKKDKPVKGKKAPSPPPKPVESSSSESSESSSEDDSSEAEQDSKTTQAKKAAPAAKKDESSSDSSDSDSSSDEEEPVKSKVAPVTKKAIEATKTAVKAVAKAGTVAAKAAGEKAAPAAKAAVAAVTGSKKGKETKSKDDDSSSSDSSSDDSDSEDGSSDEGSDAGDKAKKPNGQAAKTAESVKPNGKATGVTAKGATDKAESESGDSDSSEEDSSDEDEDGDVEMKGAPKTEAPKAATKTDQGLKRKAVDAEVEVPAKKAKSDTSSGESSTIFVGRLSWSVDDEWLKSEFDSFGTVVSARIMTADGKSRGFGYVEFSSPSEAQAALARNGQEIDGRAINVDISTPRPDKPRRDSSSPTSVVFVKGIPPSANEDSLWNVFGEYGAVSSIRMPTDRETGEYRGIAYVEFVQQDDAAKAVEAAGTLQIDSKRVMLDFAQPRDNSGGGRGGGRGGFGGGRGGFGGDRGGRGGFGGDRGGRGGRGGFGGGRGGGRGGPRGGGGGRGGFGGRGRGMPQPSGTKRYFD